MLEKLAQLLQLDVTMAKVLILGCPRSGTSMLTGLFANQGVYIGGRAHKPTVSNPKGYFETRGINDLNNQIIRKYLSWPLLDGLRARISPNINYDPRAYSFASPLRHRITPIPLRLENAIRFYASKESFCYKDPRFCVTLPAWSRFLDEKIKYLVVFREPEKTIASYIKNGVDIYQPPLVFDGKQLELAYARNYRRLIKWSNESWMFMHYDQILRGEVADGLEEFCGMKLDWGHVTLDLKRTRNADYSCTESVVRDVYKELCHLAKY